MRNRKYTAAALVILAAVLTGCSNGGKTSDSGSQTSQPTSESVVESTVSSDAESVSEDSAVDLNAVYEKIMAQQPESDSLVMFPEDEELIEGLYNGITELGLTDMLLNAPPVTGNACEIFLVAAPDEDAAKQAAKIMQSRVDSSANDTGYPEVADVWKRNASVQRSGNLVCMIVLPDGFDIPDDVFAL